MRFFTIATLVASLRPARGSILWPPAHIPAGVDAAKSGSTPALSRNCDAPSRGRARSPALRRRTSALDGRAVRAVCAAGLLRRFVEVGRMESRRKLVGVVEAIHIA